MLSNKTNLEILQELDKYVYGHTEAKKALITLINRSKIRYYQKWGLMSPTRNLLRPGKCLLVGKSGTGKTHLINTLQELVSFPFLRVDASSFSHISANGGVSSQDLQKQILRKACEYSKLEGDKYFSVDGILDQMVVFVDEFDKLSKRYDGTSSGVWNEGTQSQFLTLFENNERLSGVSWIFAGAFSGMEEDKGQTTIGFQHETIKDAERREDTDIIKYGIIPELMGRITNVVYLDTLSEKDYYKILTENIIPQKLIELSYFGIDDVDLNKDFLIEVCKKAHRSEQGVRTLHKEMDRHFLDLEFNYENTRYE